MRLVAGLLVVVGLATMGVALLGVHNVDLKVREARLATQTIPNANQNTTAGIQDRLAKLRRGSRVADEASEQMKTNGSIFTAGLTCLAVGVGVLAMPCLWRVMKSSGMTGTERERKR